MTVSHFKKCPISDSINITYFYTNDYGMELIAKYIGPIRQAENIHALSVAVDAFMFHGIDDGVWFPLERITTNVKRKEAIIRIIKDRIDKRVYFDHSTFDVTFSEDYEKIKKVTYFKPKKKKDDIRTGV